MSVVPVGGSNIMTLNVVDGQGDVTQFVTFVPEVGRWYPIDLRVPAKGKLNPTFNNDVVVYTTGRHVYAFSAAVRVWGVLELEEGAKPLPSVWSSRVTVEHGDHLSIFSLKTGKWADFDAKEWADPEARDRERGGFNSPARSGFR